VKKVGEITIRSPVVTAEVQDMQINSRDKSGLLQIRSNTGNCNHNISTKYRANYTEYYTTDLQAV
jgi:hypothetical protein